MATIKLNDPQRAFRPGDLLQGSVEIPWDVVEECEAIEVSCLWYTVGKGEEDLGALSYIKLDGRKEARVGRVWRRDFSIELPKTPVSYQGVLTSIVWAMRLRLQIPGRKAWILEHPFTLVGCRAPYLNTAWKPPTPAESVSAEIER